MNKRLLTPDKATMRDQRNGSTQVELSEPVNTLGLLKEAWVRGYLLEARVTPKQWHHQHSSPAWLSISP